MSTQNYRLVKIWTFAFEFVSPVQRISYSEQCIQLYSLLDRHTISNGLVLGPQTGRCLKYRWLSLCTIIVPYGYVS